MDKNEKLNIIQKFGLGMAIGAGDKNAVGEVVTVKMPVVMACHLAILLQIDAEDHADDENLLDAIISELRILCTPTAAHMLKLKNDKGQDKGAAPEPDDKFLARLRETFLNDQAEAASKDKRP